MTPTCFLQSRMLPSLSRWKFTTNLFSSRKMMYLARTREKIICKATKWVPVESIFFYKRPLCIRAPKQASNLIYFSVKPRAIFLRLHPDRCVHHLRLRRRQHQQEKRERRGQQHHESQYTWTNSARSISCWQLHLSALDFLTEISRLHVCGSYLYLTMMPIYCTYYRYAYNAGDVQGPCLSAFEAQHRTIQSNTEAFFSWVHIYAQYTSKTL